MKPPKRRILLAFTWCILLAGCGRTPPVDKYYTKDGDRQHVYAALNGNNEEVKKALASGTDINCRGWDGTTPLEFVVRAGKKEAILILLQNGADLNLQDDDGYSAMSLSAQKKDTWFLKTLLSHGGKVNLVNRYGKTPIFAAIDVFSIPNIDILIAAGANLNHQDRTNTTPMIEAAYHNRWDVIYHLLQAGADPTIPNNWGKTLPFFIHRNELNSDPNTPLSQDRRKVMTWLQDKKLMPL